MKPTAYGSVYHVRTDGHGRFLRIDVCTCECSQPTWQPGEDFKPTDDTCPLFDIHLRSAEILRERLGI